MRDRDNTVSEVEPVETLEMTIVELQIHDDYVEDSLSPKTEVCVRTGTILDAPTPTCGYEGDLLGRVSVWG